MNVRPWILLVIFVLLFLLIAPSLCRSCPSRLLYFSGFVGMFLIPQYLRASFQTSKGVLCFAGKSTETALTKCLLLTGYYEPTLVQFFEKVLRPGDQVCDVGANEGFYSCISAQLVGPTGKVYAVEPIPKNQRLLEANASGNQISNIQLLPFAAGREQGSAIFKDFLINSMWSSNSNSNVTQGFAYRKVPVQIRPLRDMIPDPSQLRLIKIDTEGSEQEVIEGAIEWLKLPNLIWIVEMKPAESPQILRMFSEAGFRSYATVVDSISLHGTLNTWETDFQNSDKLMNCVFIPKTAGSIDI